MNVTETPTFDRKQNHIKPESGSLRITPENAVGLPTTPEGHRVFEARVNAVIQTSKTYVKVRGKWTYLYRALDKEGNTIDFYLSPTRNAKAAKRFLGKALNGLKDWEKPKVINTDKAPTYGIAISELKAEGKCIEETVHRQVKYLNNVVEADHGKLKQLIRPVRGFKTLKTAYVTIMGFEVMRALRKGQAAIFNLTQDIRGEARIVERAFGIGAGALAEAVAVIGEQLELQPA